MRSWGAPMDDGLPVPVTVTGVVDETPSIRTVLFDVEFPFSPGQFVMVWVPGVDEVPMALSSPRSVTVQRVGEASGALCDRSHGDRIGIRGPFGNGFPPGRRVLAIAGGTGAAPLLPLAMTGTVDTFLLGARTGPELLFRSVLGGLTNLLFSTDDGSAGTRGNVTALLSGLSMENFDSICVCGPELMMRAVLDVLAEQNALDRSFFALQRYMKCGLGICGSCAIDPAGLSVCRDGPVFSGSVLINSELGTYTRDASGIKRPFRP